MSDTTTPGGFTGDPAAALTVTGTAGCCGNPPRTTELALPRPAGADASPCCGTAAEARAAGGCCGAQARTEAVAAGTVCCG